MTPATAYTAVAAICAPLAGAAFAAAADNWIAAGWASLAALYGVAIVIQEMQLVALLTKANALLASLERLPAHIREHLT
jgi:hypothetical protein